MTVGSVRVFTRNNDSTPTPGVTMSPPLQPGEGSINVLEFEETASYTIRLNTQPIANVTLTPTVVAGISGHSLGARVTSGSLTFAPSNWNQPQTITVAWDDNGIDNSSSSSDPLSLDPDRDRISATIRIHTAVMSSDPAYDNLVLAATRELFYGVNVIEDDFFSTRVSRTDLTVNEGSGTGTYSIVMGINPGSGQIRVTPRSSNPMVATVSGPLTFNTGDWRTPQFVTVTGVDDDAVNTMARTATISHRVEFIRPGSTSDITATYPVGQVTVTTMDDDVPGATLSPLEFSVDEGDSETYTVRLNTQPTHPVEITATSTDNALTFSGTLTFNPTGADEPTDLTGRWDQLQTVTVTVAEDLIENGDQREVIITNTAVSTDPNYNGRSFINRATVGDNDTGTAGLTFARTTGEALVAPQGINLDENETRAYTVKLNTEPTHDITMTLTNQGDGLVTTSPLQLTFTPENWNTPQTVTVIGIDDAIDNDPTSTTPRTTAIRHRLASADSTYRTPSGTTFERLPSVVLVVRDDDTAGLTLSTTELSILEGGRTAVYRIALTSSSDQQGILAIDRFRRES